MTIPTIIVLTIMNGAIKVSSLFEKSSGDHIFYESKRTLPIKMDGRI
jgi:hypothetical protein